MEEHRLTEPFSKEKICKYKAGDTVYITGMIYTARDAAHKKLAELMFAGEKLPFDIENAIIYYTGPTPAKHGKVIGSAGPTTSYRMDVYTPQFLEKGLLMTIGKGYRNEEVKKAFYKARAVYAVTIGGAAALISQKIKAAEIIAFDELGTEAVRKLYVEDFPVTVVYDTYGGDLYVNSKIAYLESMKNQIK